MQEKTNTLQGEISGWKVQLERIEKKLEEFISLKVSRVTISKHVEVETLKPLAEKHGEGARKRIRPSTEEREDNDPCRSPVLHAIQVTD